MPIFGREYVDRAERALVETVLLGELARRSRRSTRDLVDRALAIGGWDERVDSDFVRECIARLDNDGHVQRVGDVWELTEVGLEDLQRVGRALEAVAAAGLAEKPSRAAPPRS